MPKAARDDGGESLKDGAFQIRTPIDPPAEVAVGEWLPPLRDGKELDRDRFGIGVDLGGVASVGGIGLGLPVLG